jgi:hypothetical protein
MQNSAPIYCQVSPASLLDIFVCNCQRALVDNSGIIRKLMGMQNRSEMVMLQGLPCTPSL